VKQRIRAADTGLWRVLVCPRHTVGTSWIWRSSCLGFLALLLCMFGQTTAAQTPLVTVRVGTASARIRIEGQGAATRKWSFQKSYANVGDLGQRIEKFQLFDSTGSGMPVNQLAPGEFEAAAAAERFSYEVDLAPHVRAHDAAFVSWLNEDHGLLMLRDLLPGSFNDVERSSRSDTIRDGGPAWNTVRIKFVLPAGWMVRSAEPKDYSRESEIADTSTAVFAVGAHLRSRSVHLNEKNSGAIDMKLITTGDWAFADDEALDLAGKILRSHAEVLGGPPIGPATLILMPYPVPVTPEKWTAETRGSTVTLLLGKQPARMAALAQLSVPLTHELLHLWVPNALALEGDYDWFYEGFTVYQAARTAVRMRLLTFEEFLSGISRAYGAYLSSAERDRYSLVKASQHRWTSSQTTVYQKAMLVAFLYDLELRLQSGGKHSLDDVYRELFRRHRVTVNVATGAKQIRSVNGTEATIAVLNGRDGMQAFAPTFIERTVALDLHSELARFGLQVEQTGARSRVTVNDRLNKRQRDLLRQLGYNDAARLKERVRSRRG
jgi:M61 glycyl aminopeptidase